MKKLSFVLTLLISSVTFAEKFVVERSKVQNDIEVGISLNITHWGFGLGRIDGEITVSDFSDQNMETDTTSALYRMHYNQHYLSTQDHTLASNNPEYPRIDVSITLDSSQTLDGQNIYIHVYYEDETFYFEYDMLQDKTSFIDNQIPGQSWLAPSRPKNQKYKPTEMSDKGCWMCPAKQEDDGKPKPNPANGWRGH